MSSLLEHLPQRTPVTKGYDVSTLHLYLWRRHVVFIDTPIETTCRLYSFVYGDQHRIETNQNKTTCCL
ncbi:hypothetical protein Lser_V15G41011 [Lactuca serriola]